MGSTQADVLRTYPNSDVGIQQGSPAVRITNSEGHQVMFNIRGEGGPVGFITVSTSRALEDLGHC